MNTSIISQIAEQTDSSLVSQRDHTSDQIGQGNTLKTGKQEMTKTLWNHRDQFLGNPEQKKHYEKLRTPADKFQYLSRLITNDYSAKMSKATPQGVNTLQQEMANYLMLASQEIFGNNPNNSPTKA